MCFLAIPGHKAIKKRLIYLAQHNQVPHAQLFWGPEGSAQLSLALAFATYLNCQDRLTEDACGQCPSCLKMYKLIHPDVKFVFPTSPTKQITGKEVVNNSLLKAWRSFVQEQPYGHVGDWSYHVGSEHRQLHIPREEARQITQHVSLKALEGGYKIVLIWLPEYLHHTAANALLKILEEPLPHTIFLLVSTTPERLFSTIRSRTQQVYIPTFTDEAIAHLLTQQYSLSQEQLTQVVTLANGNLNKALKLTGDMQGDDFGQFKSWMRLCYAQDLTQLIVQAERFQQLQKEGQKNLLVYTLHMLREALLMRFTQCKLSRITPEEQAFAKKLGKSLAYGQIKVFSTWLNQAFYYVERNANPKILFLDLSLKMAQAFQKYD